MPRPVSTTNWPLSTLFPFGGLNELRLRKLKIQKALFLSEDKELSCAKYVRLVKNAERNENESLAVVIQTICAAGIRVSELRFITV